MNSTKIILLPGESVQREASSLFLAPNLKLDPDNKQIICRSAGYLLEKEKQDTLYIGLKTRAEKYFPEKNDFIIGVIKSKMQDFYLVDIGAPKLAYLGQTEFEGASKKNKPNYDAGTLIYARVSDTNKYMKTKISCLSKTQRKEWMTGESFFGDLKQGLVIKTSIEFCQKILEKQTNILKYLKSLITYEIAIGSNGYIWLKTNSNYNDTVLANFITKCQTLQENELLRDYIK